MELLEVAGTFAIIWLALWLALSVIAVTFYPWLRKLFFRPHPRIGSLLLLWYWSAPALLSLASCSLLFMPGLEAVLVDEHCHANCTAHVPVLGSLLPAVLGLLISGAILLVLLVRASLEFSAARRLQARFRVLGRDAGGYQVLDTAEPLIFTLGWWRPEIYVSAGLLAHCSRQDLAVMLRHEEEHKRRRDNLRLLAARIFGVLLPRRCIASLLSDLKLLTEQACDFRSADLYGPVEVAETLLSMQKVLQGRLVSLPAAASTFIQQEVESRIHAVLAVDARPVPGRSELVLLTLIALTVLVGFIEPLHHTTEWLITWL